jgi:hypothetical protein
MCLGQPVTRALQCLWLSSCSSWTKPVASWTRAVAQLHAAGEYRPCSAAHQAANSFWWGFPEVLPLSPCRQGAGRVQVQGGRAQPVLAPCRCKSCQWAAAEGAGDIPGLLQRHQLDSWGVLQLSVTSAGIGVCFGCFAFPATTACLDCASSGDGAAAGRC